MENCIFCKIIRGEIPSTKIYEDEKVLSFFSTSPNNQGHTLVIPKKHCRNIIDMDKQTVADLFIAVQKIAKSVFKGVQAGGINVIMNNEATAGQAVFHAHVHIIPRFKDDKLKNWDKNTPYKKGESEEIAQKIKSNI